MKLDPGMHIGLHLVFFGKTGVTVAHTRLSPQQPINQGATRQLVLTQVDSAELRKHF
jgi:hypothetical protein